MLKHGVRVASPLVRKETIMRKTRWVIECNECHNLFVVEDSYYGGDPTQLEASLPEHCDPPTWVHQRCNGSGTKAYVVGKAAPQSPN